MRSMVEGRARLIRSPATPPVTPAQAGAQPSCLTRSHEEDSAKLPDTRPGPEPGACGRDRGWERHDGPRVRPQVPTVSTCR